jgi:hypothetical protein
MCAHGVTLLFIFQTRKQKQTLVVLLPPPAQTLHTHPPRRRRTHPASTLPHNLHKTRLLQSRCKWKIVRSQLHPHLLTHRKTCALRLRTHQTCVTPLVYRPSVPTQTRQTPTRIPAFALLTLERRHNVIYCDPLLLTHDHPCTYLYVSSVWNYAS